MFQIFSALDVCSGFAKRKTKSTQSFGKIKQCLSYCVESESTISPLRYQGGQNHVSEAETAMAEYLGAPFALGLNSGGSAIFLALKLAGVSWIW